MLSGAEFSGYHVVPFVEYLPKNNQVPLPAVHKTGIVAPICNASTCEIDTKGLGVQGHPQLNGEF